jgi:hypothetical protein
MIKVGQKVKGRYYGLDFEGVILEYRHHTVRNDLIIVTVQLNEPLTLYGTVRESILVDYFIDGKVNGNACKALEGTRDITYQNHWGMGRLLP